MECDVFELRCKITAKNWIKKDQNSRNLKKMQLSTKKIIVVAYLQSPHIGVFVNCSQSSQSSHIFESQARVRLYI